MFMWAEIVDFTYPKLNFFFDLVKFFSLNRFHFGVGFNPKNPLQLRRCWQCELAIHCLEIEWFVIVCSEKRTLKEDCRLSTIIISSSFFILVFIKNRPILSSQLSMFLIIVIMKINSSCFSWMFNNSFLAYWKVWLKISVELNCAQKWFTFKTTIILNVIGMSKYHPNTKNDDLSEIFDTFALTEFLFIDVCVLCRKTHMISNVCRMEGEIRLSIKQRMPLCFSQSTWAVSSCISPNLSVFRIFTVSWFKSKFTNGQFQSAQNQSSTNGLDWNSFA